MEKRISKATFKAKACEVFRQVETLGERVIVTDHGKPTIEVRRYTSRKKDPLEVLRAGIAYFDPEPIVGLTEVSGKNR